jgi:hypothetical protein
MRNRIPLVRLPGELETLLYLISEELKSRHLFRGLQAVELNDCFFQPHLDSLILKFIGMDGDSDDVYLVYTKIMDRRSMKIEADKDSITKQSLKAYTELLVEKKKFDKLEKSNPSR